MFLLSQISWVSSIFPSFCYFSQNYPILPDFAPFRSFSSVFSTDSTFIRPLGWGGATAKPPKPPLVLVFKTSRKLYIRKTLIGFPQKSMPNFNFQSPVLPPTRSSHERLMGGNYEWYNSDTWMHVKFGERWYKDTRLEKHGVHLTGIYVW